MNNPAKAKAATALIQRPQLILPTCTVDGGGFWVFPSDVDSSVVIGSTFLSREPG
jgi:hypothetical protein